MHLVLSCLDVCVLVMMRDITCISARMRIFFNFQILNHKEANKQAERPCVF